MINRFIKLSIVIALFVVLFGFTLKTEAFPAYVRQAAKYGAKDCLFCHKDALGGEGWNERGQWLISERDRRKAETVDVAWLEEYKAPEEKPAGKEDSKEKEKKEKPMTGNWKLETGNLN